MSNCNLPINTQYYIEEYVQRFCSDNRNKLKTDAEIRKRIIVCEKDPARIAFVKKYYPDVLVCEPENCKEFTLANSDHGGVDGCDCAEILALIEAGKIGTTPLIPHRYRLEDIEEAYYLFENKLDGVIKIAIEP